MEEVGQVVGEEGRIIVSSDGSLLVRIIFFVICLVDLVEFSREQFTVSVPTLM